MGLNRNWLSGLIRWLVLVGYVPKLAGRGFGRCRSIWRWFRSDPWRCYFAPLTSEANLVDLHLPNIYQNWCAWLIQPPLRFAAGFGPIGYDHERTSIGCRRAFPADLVHSDRSDPHQIWQERPFVCPGGFDAASAVRPIGCDSNGGHRVLFIGFRGRFSGLPPARWTSKSVCKVSYASPSICHWFRSNACRSTCQALGSGAFVPDLHLPNFRLNWRARLMLGPGRLGPGFVPIRADQEMAFIEA